MKYNFLIGGKAGQGVNKASELISDFFLSRGYFVFNYRDYPSLIKGGHNFNIISVSEKKTGSFDYSFDGILALDKETIEIHKKNLKKNGFIIGYEKFSDLGIDINLAVLGSFFHALGFDKKEFLNLIKGEFNDEESIKAAAKGFDNSEIKKNFSFPEIKREIKYMTGSMGVALGALNSELNIYLGYPMTPSTGVMEELAEKVEEGSAKTKNKLVVFQPENELSVVNSALGAGFAGANVMIGTSGGGFDLMSEALSFQGMSEIPLVVYLASRSGPGTGVPTYTGQADLNIALKSGHGEFPRIVIASGDPLECIEKTNEAVYLSQKFNILSIILSDKHLAESGYSFSDEIKKSLKIKKNREIPGLKNIVVKANGYEHDKKGNTTEDAEIIEKNAENRLRKYEGIKKECRKFEMYKIHGNQKSRNLVVGWGSTKGAVLDAIEELDCKFLQVIYLKPMSDIIKDEIKKAKKVILVENNATGQLGRVIREKTGFKIEKENRILKYDARPFTCNELKKEIEKRLR